MPLIRTFRFFVPTFPRLKTARIRLRMEALEDRAIPSAGPANVFHPMIMAGSLTASPADSPAARIDPNVASSPYAGVGSLEIDTATKSYLATATAIGQRYILTAAHVVDLNNDGKVDAKDGLTGVYFILNVNGDETYRIPVTGYNVDPDWTGFAHPSVNDDVAVLTLGEDLPSDVPIYSLPSTDLAKKTVLTFVGYGESGDGIKGYTTPGSATIKRVGYNTVDAFYGQDDAGRPQANEVFRFDFSSPTGKGPLGGRSLGNSRETQLGPGDSGGPAFTTAKDGSLTLAGLATYTQGANAPKFGSMGGGMNVYTYESFIDSVIDPSDSSSSGSSGTTSPPSHGGGGVVVGANPLQISIVFPPPPPPPDPPPTPKPPPELLPPAIVPMVPPNDVKPPPELLPPPVYPPVDPIPTTDPGPTGPTDGGPIDAIDSAVVSANPTPIKP